MRPTDALLHRRVMLDVCRQKLATRPVELGAGGHEEVALILYQIIHDCDIYYVSADMTAVAKAAGKTMPRQELRRDDLPSERGFMVFDTPVSHMELADGSVPIVGFAWGPSAWGDTEFGRKHPDAECVCDLPRCAACQEIFRRYMAEPPGEYKWENDPDKDKLANCECGTCTCEASEPLGAGQEFEIFPLGAFPQTSMLVPVYEDPDHEVWMKWIIGDTPVNDIVDISGVLLATWTLMQQSLSVSQKLPADRAERRRSARAQLPSDVIVVRLRRHSVDDENTDPTPEGSASWSHRWLVGGHWRNQWLPSRAAHRLQWIAGYVKGPANMPLVVKDKVTAWIR